MYGSSSRPPRLGGNGPGAHASEHGNGAHTDLSPHRRTVGSPRPGAYGLRGGGTLAHRDTHPGGHGCSGEYTRSGVVTYRHADYS